MIEVSHLLIILAYGILHLHGALHNWQYLFIIEGSVTCFLAAVAWFWLPISPGTAWFLNERQKTFATSRIQLDSVRYLQKTYGADGVEVVSERLTKRDVIETAKDWKLWFILGFNICASVPGQAFSVFLPLVVKGLGYKSIEANLVGHPTRSTVITPLTKIRCLFLLTSVEPLGSISSPLFRIDGEPASLQSSGIAI